MRATSTRAESRGSRPTKADSGERRTLCWRKPDSNPPVPCRGQHFSRPPRTRRRQTGSAARTGFDDRQAQVYRAPSQAGPGNDINAGSPGFQKAPTRGPASLVARCFLRAEHQLNDAQARSMRTPTMTRIVARTGRNTLSGTRALRWLPKKMPGSEPMTSEPSISPGSIRSCVKSRQRS